MVYEIVISELAEKQLDECLRYLIDVKRNIQAARRLVDDFEDTKKELSIVASSLRYCDDPYLKSEGYRKMLFKKHRYLFIYRIIDERIEVNAMYHELQDYENMFSSDKVKPH